jgi:hypothetical protein
MTNLIEIERWEDGIYQLETSDPVVGGPDGIDNLQAKQLANRTRYLKKAIETGQSNLDAHVASDDPHPQYATHADLAEKLAALVAQSPETLDTLSELAKALGNDPNFATTIANQLALKASIDSPSLTGAPTATTPPQFDKSKRIATMEAVKLAGMQASGITYLATSTALTAAHVGQTIELQGSAPYVVTLVAQTATMLGCRVEFLNNSSANVTIAASGGDRIVGAASVGLTSLVMLPGDTLTIEANGVGYWIPVSGSAQLQMAGAFASLLANSGYQKLPSGLIFQWGQGTTQSSGGSPVAFPVAFPNAVLAVVVGNQYASVGASVTFGWQAVSKAQFNVYCSQAAANNFSWVAIGY